MMKNKYKVLIITCWILLGIAFVVKLFSKNLFNIVITNETFISINNWLNNSWTRYIVFAIVYAPATYLMYLSMINQKIGKDLWYLLICLPVPLIKDKVIWIGIILDIILMAVIPLIRNKFKNWLRVVICIILVCTYQLIILFIRNLGVYIPSSDVLTGVIMDIDYYIMIILYYLYAIYVIKINRNKEV